jgi:hypothetical protein
MSLKQPVCIGCDDQAIDHAACLLGGARDRGTCPRLNVSMISIVPPQQGHGSHNVSDAGFIGVAWFLFRSACPDPSCEADTRKAPDAGVYLGNGKDTTQNS